MKVIGLAGRKGSGKDTAAQILINQGYELIKFADPLKGMLRYLLDYQSMAHDEIERRIEGDMKEDSCAQLGMNPTRWAMQTLGTEWGRDLLSNEIWTSAFYNRAQQFDKVVCTDVRFPNEITTITQGLGGYIYRVVRPNSGKSDTHTSETQIDDLQVDAEILNDGSIEQLQQKLIALIK